MGTSSTRSWRERSGPRWSRRNGIERHGGVSVDRQGRWRLRTGLRKRSPAAGPTGKLSGMDYLQIAILALVQGAAELLPVSSSAHVIVAEKLMGMDPSAPEMTFLLVMLHTGTMFAVLAYFWPRWKGLFRRAEPAEGPGHGSGLRFVALVILATACTGVIGLGLKVLIENVILVRLLGHERGEVEHLFKNLGLMAAALFAVGLFIIAAGWRRRREDPAALNGRSAALIGVVQGLCLPLRGFSRSGATISTALFCGIPRLLAEEFSFALAVVLTPPVIVLELYRLLRAREWSGGGDLVDLLLPGLVGMVFSFVAGLVALKFLSRVLEQGGWRYFGYYCVLASGGVLAAYLAGL
jgi:undecaprenyl-diphosphatase